VLNKSERKRACNLLFLLVDEVYFMISENLIQYLTRLGLFIFPVQPNKKPYSKTKGWKDATNNPVEAIALFEKRPDALIAIATESSHLIVFDVDNHPDEFDDDGNPKDGLKSYAELRAEHGEFPPTWVVKTPSGGLHYYFTTTKMFKRAVGKLAPGIDLLVKGSYVVAPSETDSCKYQFASGFSWYDIDQPAPCPQWILDWLEENKNTQRQTKTSQNQAGVGQTTNAADIIPEGQRNDTLYRRACSLRAKGLSYNEILGAITVTNYEQCQPPLGDAEMVTLVESACQHAPGEAREALQKAEYEEKINEFGIYAEGIRVVRFLSEKKWDLYDPAVLDELAATSFDPVAKWFVEKTIKEEVMIPSNVVKALISDHLKSADTVDLTWDELKSQETCQFEWRVEGIFSTKGTSVFASPPKSGKSTLIRWLIYCLTTGMPWLEHQVKPCKVAYFASEENIEAIKKLLLMLEDSFGAMPADSLHLKIGAPNTRLFVKQVEEKIVAHGVQFIIIDPLFDALNVGDTNSYMETNGAMKTIRRIAQRHNVHILGLHHANKVSDGSSANGILGSQAIRGSSDHNLWLNGEKDAPRYLWSENRLGTLLGGYCFQGGRVILHSDGSLSLGTSLTQEQKALLEELKYIYRIHRVLSKCPGGLNKSQIRDGVTGTGTKIDKGLEFGLNLGIFWTEEPKQRGAVYTVSERFREPDELNTYIQDEYDVIPSDIEQDE
jgi:hypothetical protein